MKFRSMTLLLPLCLLAGCLSQSTKDDLKSLGTEVGQKVGQALKDEGVKIAAETKTAAFEGAKSATATTIKNDPDIAPEKKQDLLAQLAGAGGFAGIGGVLFAMAKAKAAAKAKQALGIVVNAAGDLPQDAFSVLTKSVKDAGGSHPSIKSLIEEVKL